MSPKNENNPWGLSDETSHVTTQNSSFNFYSGGGKPADQLGSPVYNTLTDSSPVPT
eukprot:SAG22_NODE_336_length_12071_cov_10.875125_14_plen_56_part_00